MGLKLSAIWRRLKVQLEYHQKLIAENVNLKAIQSSQRRIARLTFLLEAYQKKVA